MAICLEYAGNIENQRRLTILLLRGSCGCLCASRVKHVDEQEKDIRGRQCNCRISRSSWLCLDPCRQYREPGFSNPRAACRILDSSGTTSSTDESLFVKLLSHTCKTVADETGTLSSLVSPLPRLPAFSIHLKRAVNC